MTAMAGKNRQGDLKLLLAEVIQHIAQVRDYLVDPSPSAMADLRHKVAYINTLAMVARNHNFDLESAESDDEKNKRLFHGLAAITSHLFRIAELALNVARQYDHLTNPDFLDDYDLDVFFEHIDFGLSLIRPALEQKKMKLVVRLCQVEERLDIQYSIRFARLIKELDHGCGNPGNRVTALMTIHYLERIGDLIMEIGEEMIYIILGHNLKFSQYQALGVGLRASGRDGRLADIGGFHSIWSGRSGCRINVVDGDAADVNRAEPVLFKHGPVAKMEEERKSLTTWAALWPGLPPAIQAFVPAGPGGEAGLLLEYIHGETLYDMMMGPDDVRARKELTGALHLMASIWKETRVDEEVCAGFVRQAEKRLGPVRTLYPELINVRGAFGNITIKSIDHILNMAREIERELAAPFSVRIHGDFNLSNVLRDDKGSYRLIDLHRSRLFDYAQDISVMIMSILRLPLSSVEEREKLSKAARLVWTFAKDFADTAADPTIEARLAFGLARSYLTSARFEPRRSRAATYVGYSRYIWESLIKFSQKKCPWDDFKLDKRLLYV
ncbi:hypothetical protein C4J81_07305 [Deltaproteobacteria bacterium Smac51]|nr:hypothetical protein C4J81_07305 [Deltaproteobacteria bacterium Smac51]